MGNTLKKCRSFVHLLCRERKRALKQALGRLVLFEMGLNCSSKSIVNTPDFSRITMGRHCSLGDFSILDIADDPCAPDRKGSIELGQYVYIGEQCNIRAGGSSIRIGSHSMIANNVVMVSVNHRTDIGNPMMFQPWDYRKEGVEIGEDCWIGSHSTILPGSRIGSGAVIAAGSIIRGDIPPMTIWGGNPARELKRRV